MSELDEVKEELDECLATADELDLKIAQLQRRMVELQCLTPVSLANFLRLGDE